MICSYTVVRIAPEAFRADVPYSVLLVDLAPGLRVTARLVGDKGEAGLSVGQPLTFDRVDERGVYWFRSL
ncbi:MAG: OB-fold domain-containing protein [Deltaproteobacteria bacterium]|nr:OB-fold domain-containing protein [Deltaproteobacteria bacterium]